MTRAKHRRARRGRRAAERTRAQLAANISAARAVARFQPPEGVALHGQAGWRAQVLWAVRLDEVMRRLRPAEWRRRQHRSVAAINRAIRECYPPDKVRQLFTAHAAREARWYA